MIQGPASYLSALHASPANRQRQGITSLDQRVAARADEVSEAGTATHTSVSNKPTPVTNKPNPAIASAVADPNIDALYKALEKLWESKRNFTGKQFLDAVRTFTNSKGEQPYRQIPTQTAALTTIMVRLKQASGDQSQTYAALREATGWAVVANGIYNNFLLKMLIRPEEDLEPW